MVSKIAESKSDPSKPGGESELRVVQLSEKVDIEAYLTTFAHLITAYGVTKAKWIFKLAPQLMGKAQQAYAALPKDQALNYDSVKVAILRRYDITEEHTAKGSGQLARGLRRRIGSWQSDWVIWQTGG